MARSRTYIATPPGATIKEQLEDRGMSQKEFAFRMGMSEKHISNLINGNVQLTPDVANRLEMVLGLPAKFWINLEGIYRDKLAKVEDENTMDDDIEFARNFPYREMANNGWLPNTQRPQDRVIALRKFFEVASLSFIKSGMVIPGIAYRRQTITEKSDYALIAWSQKAKLESRTIKVAPINIQKLQKSLPKIRNMTVLDPDEFCIKLINIMAECGIALVFLPHIGGSFLHGATFYDKDKIVIGLTVRGKDADKFWFSLFHEIAHVVLGHLNQDGTSDDEEAQADEFAREQLIPHDRFAEFTAKNSFGEREISAFANEIGIDPGIVVGRLQKENYIPFSWHNSLKKKYLLSA